MLTEIVKRALVETIVDIGQLTKTEKRELNAAVKRGYLSKGKGGPFPKEKTVYAHPGFDFGVDREYHYQEFKRLAVWDERMRAARKAAGSPI